MLDPGARRDAHRRAGGKGILGSATAGDGPWRRHRENSMYFRYWTLEARVLAYFPPYLAHT